MVSCEKVKFDDDFLEGQPDERRLIQTVDVGSEQNEVIELGAGRSFLCVLVGPRRGPNSIPRAGSPREGGFEKKSPARPKGGAGVNSRAGWSRLGGVAGEEDERQGTVGVQVVPDIGAIGQTYEVSIVP